MDKTEKPSPRDEFAYLEEMTATQGPTLIKELFVGKNIKAMARLLLKDEPRYMVIFQRLHYLGGMRTKWHKAVSQVAERSKNDRAKEITDQKLEDALDAARDAGKAVLPKGRPVDIAKAFLATKRPHLAYVGKQWLDYAGTCYSEVEEGGIGAEVQAFMDGAVDADTGERFIIGPREVDHVVDALRKACFGAEGSSSPCWRDGADGLEHPANSIIAVNNGLLHVPSGKLMAHTHRFFTRTALPFDYEPDAAAPVAFLAFLESIWPEQGVPPKEAEANRQNKATLQEVMGHMLTAETRYQRIWLFVGASRGGKGVLTRLITKMLGATNVVSVAAAKFGTPFGLAGLIGKQLAIMPDFRLGRGTQNTPLIIERLLSISGEDSMSVDRKFLGDWEGKLPVKIILASNMQVAFPDQAGALLNRLVVLVFKKSFADNPDVTLEGRLEAELPSILNWALDGLRRLEARVDDRGRPLGFIAPPAGETVLRSIARRGSTVRAFLDEMCVLGRGERIDKDTLYLTFKEWLEDSDLEDHYSESTFAKELFDASAYRVESKRLRVDGAQVQHYVGVSIRG